jgi:RNA polymerase sigma-70 factor, ECF subfamily
MLGREVRVRGQVAGSDGAGSARAAAFSQLTDRHLGSFYRLAAVLLGSEPEAQDAVQDAAVIAWERFASLRDPERFEAWFQRILVNRCRDRLRRRRRVRTVSLDDRLAAETVARDVTLVDRDALRRALDSLTADQRLVVVLRYSAGLSLAEIADRTGTRLGTVKSRLHYAREALHAAHDAADRGSGRATS